MIRSLLPGMALMVSPVFAQESQKLADGLTRDLIAREPLLKNPVAVSVDVDGSIYVAETARRQTVDLDIREFKEWIPETLALRSVEERRELYRKILAPGTVKHGSLVDRNGDAKVDMGDLTTISEKILRLTDADGDGMIEKSQVFAEDFNTGVTGIAAGVMAWRGDVYASIIPDLWKLRDTKGTGTADRREALLTGFGVHVAYAGHDMHGICLGPDGKLYWTIGDKGVNLVSKEGKRWALPDEGCLMRCNQDGSKFEIVARGLRNVQQIAFDDYGNVFGVDNDSDAKGEKERFVYIAEDSDTGWRCYYQYRGSNYNPWMDESLSVPAGKNQPSYFTPPICSYMDGPSGFARDPGTALNNRYRGSFFMTSFPAGILYSFKTEPDGAGFRMTDSHVVDKGPAYVGCNFGPDGALYLADWAGGYPLKEKGAIWKLDDLTVKGSAIRKEVASMLKVGPKKVSDADLLTRLKHPDQRVRCDAQWELAIRPTGIDLLETAAARWKEEPLACTHALWGLTQAARFSPALLETLLTARAENTRAQAAKWAGETSHQAVPQLIPLLADPSPVVRYRAAVAIGKLRMDDALTGILTMLSENANRDAYLRHAGVLALVGMKREAAVFASKHQLPAVRLAAAIAFRRQGSAEASSLLNDPDLEVATEAAHSIYDDASIPSAIPALAAVLEQSQSVPANRRSISANRITADKVSAMRLAKYAFDVGWAMELRIAALEALASWPTELTLDSVDGRWHPFPAADIDVARAAFMRFAATKEGHTDPAFAKALAETSKALGVAADSASLARDAQDPNNTPDVRLQALSSLKTAAPAEFANIARGLLSEKSVEIRMGTAKLLGAAASLDYAVEAAVKSKDVAERQNAISLLGKSDDPKALAALQSLAVDFMKNPELQLELLLVFSSRPGLSKELESATAALATKGPSGSFLPSLAGGDAARGKQIFETHIGASCTACHRIGETGSNVGPSLTKVGEKSREFILESIVSPQSEIAAGYGMQSVVKKDGTTVSGAPKTETSEAVVLLQPDGTALSIPAAEIASRTTAMSQMPPMGSVLNVAELRDVVEYLSQRK